MKILCLYGNICAMELFTWIKEQGHETVTEQNRIEAEWVKEESFDLVISYTYQYIIKQQIIDVVNGNIINLHTSYLPFDRGASPNLFNILEGSPRGVSIHYVNAGLDSGDIIAQKLVALEKGATLKNSYEQLDREIKELFKSIFALYRYWNSMRKRCVGNGTYHREKELEPVKRKFENWNWDISVEQFLKTVKQGWEDTIYGKGS